MGCLRLKSSVESWVLWRSNEPVWVRGDLAGLPSPDPVGLADQTETTCTLVLFLSKL
jgi:hypothetical protein